MWWNLNKSIIQFVFFWLSDLITLLENTMTLALHILLCSIVQKVSHRIKSKIFKLNQYLARTLRCLRVIRWPSLNLPLHVVMHIDNFILRKPLWKNFSDGPLRWSGKKETATQTLREMQLEWNHSVRGTKKNRHFFVNHVYFHVMTSGHRSHHRSAVTWWPYKVSCSTLRNDSEEVSSLRL